MLNNPYPLTQEQRYAYKKLLNKALEFFGFNKNYFIGYYRKYTVSFALSNAKEVFEAFKK